MNKQNNWKEGLKDLCTRFGLDLEDRGEDDTDWGAVQIWKETEDFIEKEIALAKEEERKKFDETLRQIQVSMVYNNEWKEDAIRLSDFLQTLKENKYETR